jgi:CBS domain containing-hemolysin-like protein
MAFEDKDGKRDEFNSTVNQIFQLKNLTAKELMTPIAKVQMASSITTLAEVRHLLSVHYAPIIPIYHRYPHNVVAIAAIRDLLTLDENKKIIDVAHSPWFVTQNTSPLQLLQQFRRNNQSTAVILESSGHAVGILTLDQVLSTIFGEESESKLMEDSPYYIERTLSAEMSVSRFNQDFDAELPEDKGNTLSELILRRLDHFPVKEETICIGEFAFTIKDLTLRNIRTLSVRTIRS